MAYVIQYQNKGNKKYPRRIRNHKIWFPFLFFIITIFSVTVISVSYGGFKWLLPGDPDVTAFAFEEFVDSLSMGEPFGEAVTAFCREIIRSGL